MPPRKTAKLKAKPGPAEVKWGAMPSHLLHHIYIKLGSQRDRMLVAEVCRAWRDASQTPSLWSKLELCLESDTDYASAESFMVWLQKRKGEVKELTLSFRQQSFVTGPAHQERKLRCWGLITAAIASLGGTLQDLSVWHAHGSLTISGWAAALHCLKAASFISRDTVWDASSLSCNSSLEKLELGSTNSTLMVATALPRQLKTLCLSECGLRVIPEGLSPTALPNLRALDLNHNLFDDLEGLAALTGLQALYLDNCSLSSVPSDLSTLVNLRIFHLGGPLCDNEADEVPDVEELSTLLANFEKLQVLQINDCDFSQAGILPGAICDLPQLSVLFVDTTGIDALQPRGCYLPQLTKLCLGKGALMQSIEALHQCTQLKVLNINWHDDMEEAGEHEPEFAEEVLSSLGSALAAHPSLHKVNVFFSKGKSTTLSLVALQMIVKLASAPQLEVQILNTTDLEDGAEEGVGGRDSFPDLMLPNLDALDEAAAYV